MVGKEKDVTEYGSRGPRPEMETRYAEALALYRTTEMSVAEICRRTGAHLSAFRSYIYRCHRDLLFARHGIKTTDKYTSETKLRKHFGQQKNTRIKYRDAIRACDNAAYIEFNVSQIARMFHLNPSALGNQLRVHYPEILERREKERRRLGVNDNLHRGAKSWCKEQYAEAVEHLRTTDDTIRQTAELYDLSYSGLREHVIYYYKAIVRKRARRRDLAKAAKNRGELTGSGLRHEPSPLSVQKYREAVRLYRTTAMTQREIAEATGVSVSGLRNHLLEWYRELIMEHRGAEYRKERDSFHGTKRYLKSTAAKYAEAIRRLKESGRPTAEVAREFGLHPDSFREYLYEHEPELAARLGKTRLENGRLVYVRSSEKYAEAVRMYETTAEPLKSIAKRLGIQYNSIGGFVRRNRPDAIAAHNRLVEQEERRREEDDTRRLGKEQAESAALALKKVTEEKERILQALKQTGGHKRNAAKLLGICKSTLYNKIKLLDIK